MNNLKLLWLGVESHMNKFNSDFHTLKDFFMIHQQCDETVTNYFDILNAARVNTELSKGNLTKHE